MIRDEFKARYTTIPFSTSMRDHKSNSIPEDIITLLHKHREMELMTVIDGKAKLFAGGQSCVIEKGDIVVISPYMLHNATILANHDFKHYCFCFDLKLIPDKKLKNDLESGICRINHLIKSDEKIAKELSCLLRNTYEVHARRQQGWELRVTGNLTVFFGLLAENGYIARNELNSLSNDICYRFIDYIEKNYTQQITSADAAKNFYISKSYFCRIFKQNFGKGFHNYVNMFRVEKARVLLITTDLSISCIAAQVGFNSFSFFCKIFKTYLSATPSEYRKQHQII